MKEWIRKWLELPTYEDAQRAMRDKASDLLETSYSERYGERLEREVEKEISNQLEFIDISHCITDRINLIYQDIQKANASRIAESKELNRKELIEYMKTPAFIEEAVAAINKVQLKGKL